MTNSQRLVAVRACIDNWFSNQHPDQEWEAIESILVSDGCYCGRRFSFEPYSAIWFVEEHQVKIFAADGTVAACFDSEHIFVEASVEPQRKAA